MTHKVLHIRDDEVLGEFLRIYNEIKPSLIAFDVEISQPRRDNKPSLISVAVPYLLDVSLRGQEVVEDIWALPSQGGWTSVREGSKYMELGCDEVRCVPSTVVLLDVGSLSEGVLGDALQSLFCSRRCARAMCGDDTTSFSALGIEPCGMIDLQLLELSRGGSEFSLAKLSRNYNVGEKCKWNHVGMRWHGPLSENAMRYAAKDALLTLAVYMVMLNVGTPPVLPSAAQYSSNLTGSTVGAAVSEAEIASACERLSKCSIFLGKKLPDNAKVLHALQNSIAGSSTTQEQKQRCRVVLDELVRRGILVSDSDNGLLPTAKMIRGWSEPRLTQKEFSDVVRHVNAQQLPCSYISLLCNIAVQFWRREDVLTRRAKAQAAIHHMISTHQLADVGGKLHRTIRV